MHNPAAENMLEREPEPRVPDNVYAFVRHEYGYGTTIVNPRQVGDAIVCKLYVTTQEMDVGVVDTLIIDMSEPGNPGIVQRPDPREFAVKASVLMTIAEETAHVRLTADACAGNP